MKSHFHPILLTALTISLLGCGMRVQAQGAWVTWPVSAGGNGHQFLVVGPSSGLTWNVANQIAQNTYGGHLAVITSAAENNFVFSLVNSSRYFTAQNGSGPAIGGFNAGTAANPNWSWVTGEAFSYTNWQPGDPDYGNFGYGTENRIAYYSGTGNLPSSQWNDISENDPNIGGFVVERLVPVPAPESNTNTLLLLGVAVSLGVALLSLVQLGVIVLLLVQIRNLAAKRQ